MLYYIFVFLSVAVLSVGIMLLREPFFSFAYATSVLLNSMLDPGKDEKAKQKSLIASLGKMLPRFGLILLLTCLVVMVGLLPMIFYMKVMNSLSAGDLDMRSIWFFISMILGSFVLFIHPSKKKEDYSPWSKLLHRMILDNYNISLALFRMDKRFFRKKLKREDKSFVIVSGLARGGTTALTNLLYESGKFHSLSYNNMPFLLAVNSWRKLYKPRKNNLKERAHGDSILFGYDTVEALEEYFYKVHLNDSYIGEKTLERHDISPDVYKSYREYQKLVQEKEDTVYLAKNNNLMLRFPSVRNMDEEFSLLLMVRAPLTHAYSLLSQHKRFTEIQGEDPFTREYMDWLGHHEFGQNHKVFDLPGMERREEYDPFGMDYWLVVWISYYRYILSLPGDDKLQLIDYSDLCNRPVELLEALGDRIGVSMKVSDRESYAERQVSGLEYDELLLKEADELHQELLKSKFQA